MFIPIRDQGVPRRRNSHARSVRRLARTSTLSLDSDWTSGSHGSGGSSSTITQESYSRSRFDPERRRKRRKTRQQLSMDLVKMEKEVKPEDEVDVFSFLVKDNAEHSQPSHVSPSISPPPPAPTPPPPAIPSRLTSIMIDTARGYDSDSGISMGNSSIAAEKKKQTILPPLPEPPRQILRDIEDWRAAEQFERSQWSWPEAPPPMQQAAIDWRPFTPMESLYNPGQPFQALEPVPPLVRLPAHHDYIASQMAKDESKVKPLFRQFGKINYRLLLHLQEEITDLEEELERLDSWESHLEQERRDTHPGARRLSWQWNHAELHARRYDLLGRIQAKMEQYTQQLHSFSKLRRDFPKASESDVNELRNWTRNDRRLSSSEHRSLNHGPDFIDLDTSLPPRKEESTFPASLLFVNTVSLLAFRLVPGILNRLILLSTAIAIGAFVLEKMDHNTTVWSSERIYCWIATSLLAAILL